MKFLFVFIFSIFCLAAEEGPTAPDPLPPPEGANGPAQPINQLTN